MNVGGGGRWPAGVDVAGDLLLVPPANLGAGGSAVGCVGCFVFLIFILSN